MKEFLKARPIGIGLVLGLGGLMTVGCTDPNYSGEGYEFVVEGQVTDPGKESLKAEIYEIRDVNGMADGWFSIGNTHQLHDNCDCHGMWRGEKQYGEVRTEDGEVIEPSDVAIGACVAFTGAIRANNEGKTWTERPVYEVAQIVPCD